MARKLRVQYPGAIYHVMNRGDHCEPIFRSAKDRELFLKTLGEACEKTDWQVHAWCLMRNHFHLMVETPRANLVPGMKWFLGTDTMRFNHRHRLFGHLFSDRYKALPVEGSATGYLKTVCDYVHLNPARANLLPAKGKLSDFSSKQLEIMKIISGQEKLSELCPMLHASSQESCLLPSSALVNLLNRFLTGEITAKDVEVLADALEMNEAVTYEQLREQIIADTLFALSNPEINGALNRANVTTLIQRLENELK